MVCVDSMMTRQLKTDENGNTYSVPAPLVHRLIFAIFGALSVIAGYMVVWAVNDVRKESRQETQQNKVIEDIEEIKRILSKGVLPRADERLRALDKYLRAEIKAVKLELGQVKQELRDWSTREIAIRGALEAHMNDNQRHDGHKHD